jgi:hypothetical protein
MVQRRVIAISALNQSFAIAERSIKVWHRECTKSGCNEVKFATEDTPMAVSKKSLPTASPAAKTTKTKSDKATEVTPLTSTNLKPAMYSRF